MRGATEMNDLSRYMNDEGLKALKKQLSKEPDTSHIVIPPVFKLTFLSVLVITTACGLGQIVLAAIWIAPTTDQQSSIKLRLES